MATASQFMTVTTVELVGSFANYTVPDNSTAEVTFGGEFQIFTPGGQFLLQAYNGANQGAFAKYIAVVPGAVADNNNNSGNSAPGGLIFGPGHEFRSQDSGAYVNLIIRTWST